MLLQGIDLNRLDDRRALLTGLDRFRRAADESGMVEGMDEFQRRLQVQSLLFASLMTLLVGAVFSVLSDYGYASPRFNRGLGIGGTFFFLFFFWVAASVFLSRRYK